MARGEDERAHKIKSVHIEPVSYDFSAALLAEGTEVLGINQLPGETVGGYGSAFEPALINPFLYHVGPNMQGFC